MPISPLRRQPKAAGPVKTPLDMALEAVKEYDELRTQEALIKKRKDALAAQIKEYAAEHGVKNQTGSYLCEAGGYVFGSQARKSVTFKEAETLVFLKEKGFTSAIKIVESVDSNAMEKLVDDGSVTAEDIQRLTTIKTTFAVDVKFKEDMPVVEESTVGLAASRKGKK